MLITVMQQIQLTFGALERIKSSGHQDTTLLMRAVRTAGKTVLNSVQLLSTKLEMHHASHGLTIMQQKMFMV